MDFISMCKIEPRLADLEQEIVSFRETKRRLGAYVDRDWYRHFKPRMIRLVGFMAENEALANAECYDTAYMHLSGLLANRKKRPLNDC